MDSTSSAQERKLLACSARVTTYLHVAHRDTVRERPAGDTERHRETQRDTERHRETQRDTERHSGTCREARRLAGVGTQAWRHGCAAAPPRRRPGAGRAAAARWQRAPSAPQAARPAGTAAWPRSAARCVRTPARGDGWATGVGAHAEQRRPGSASRPERATSLRAWCRSSCRGACAVRATVLPVCRAAVCLFRRHSVWCQHRANCSHAAPGRCERPSRCRTPLLVSTSPQAAPYGKDREALVTRSDFALCTIRYTGWSQRNTRTPSLWSVVTRGESSRASAGP